AQVAALGKLQAPLRPERDLNRVAYAARAIVFSARQLVRPDLRAALQQVPALHETAVQLAERCRALASAVADGRAVESEEPLPRPIDHPERATAIAAVWLERMDQSLRAAAAAIAG